MITFDMIKRGYESGIVRLIESPDDDYVVCGIGDNYFYFGAGELKPDEYLAQVSTELFLRDIFEVLDKDFRGSPEFDDEYRYYEAFLNEHLKEIDNMQRGGFGQGSITLDMVKRAYEAGIIKVVADTDSKGVLGKIGDLCFTFGGWDACELDLDDFLRNYQGERLIKSIYKGLVDLQNDVEMDEYRYFETYLNAYLKDVSHEKEPEASEIQGADVPLNRNNGTLSAIDKIMAASSALYNAFLTISEINEGKWKKGQEPFEFSCGTSSMLADAVDDLREIFGKLCGVARVDVKSLAKQISENNPALAREVFYIHDRGVEREDIVSRLPDLGLSVDDFTDEEIDIVAERFHEGLEHHDSYWDCYWATADIAIKEVLVEKSRVEEGKNIGWNSIEEMVDRALESIRGVGIDMGSGYYGMTEFDVDGEKMEVVVEVCQFVDKEEKRDFYGVYYEVGYYDGDTLWADWRYTDALDVDELKKVVLELNNTDFMEDVRKEIQKGDIEAVIGSAASRSNATQGFGTMDSELGIRDGIVK